MRRAVLVLAVVLASPLPAAELRVEGGGSLDLSEHVVVADVDNRIALTRVQQVFANRSDARLEGVYLFPVPPGATLSDFAMWVGGRKVSAAVVEKEAGRRIYDSYKDRGQDPALLEHVKGNVFRVSVFPIEPRSEVRIELVYREVLPYDAGTCRYAYPVRSSAGLGVRTGRFRLEVRLRSAIPIASVVPETPGAEVASSSDRLATVVYERTDARIEDDFAVLYRLAGDRTHLEWLAHRPDPAREGHFLLVLSPDETSAGDRIAAKDMTFVLDVSGSMSGPKIDQARRALRYCIGSLGSEDRFDILAFANDVRSFGGGLVPASPGARQRASDWVDLLSAAGGTALAPALATALARPVAEDRPHLVVLLTDGQPTVGERTASRIVDAARAALAPGCRVYTFGIGTPQDYDRELLDAIARESGGAAASIGPTGDIEATVSAFQDKISHPVLTNLALDWGGAAVADVQPLRLPPLFRGTQLLVAGRYSGTGPCTIALTGRLGARLVRIERTIELGAKDESHPGLPGIWAAWRVDSLLYEMRIGGESKEVKADVLRLALEHRLATPYTSFLVLENEAEFRRWGLEEGGAQEFRALNGIETDHGETDDAPLRGKSTNSAIGAGGGAGGAFGGRLGGKQDLVERGGGDGTIAAVEMALKWLDAEQHPSEGTWAGGDLRRTGLALLAFLGAGHTHNAGKYKDTVKLALKWLKDRQDDQGCLGPRDATSVEDHAIATLAFVEAYGLTKSPLLLDGARRSVDYLLAARAPGSAWGDSSTTAWALLAMKSARVAGLDVPREAFDDAIAWMERVTDGDTGQVGLRARGDGGLAPDPARFDRHETLAAASILARILTGTERGAEILRRQGDLLAADLPEWTPRKIDHRYWYWGSLAMFQLGGDSWKTWNGAMKRALVENQRTDGDERGSWDPIGAWGEAGGRVESTALATLSLEIYYRYDRVFR